MALRTVVYTRKSTKDEDEKQINSLYRQKQDTDDYFARHERAETDPEKILIWTVNDGVDWFFEDASAKVIGRKKFNEMLATIRKNRFEVLWCPELTRLSRNVFDTAQIVQLLEPYDNKGNTHLKEIRTLDKVFTTSPTDRFTLTLFMTIAKYENDQRAENIKSGMQYIRRKGGTVGKAPVGYLNKGDKKGEKYVTQDPETFHKCRELWEMLLSEAYTLQQIYHRKDELSIHHFWSGKKRLVSNTTIREMFANWYYAGKQRYFDDKTGETQLIDGNHPAVVTEKEFQNAQFILQRMGHKHAKIDRAYDIGDLIKSIMVSGITEVERADGSIVPAPVLYESRTRLTCAKCKHRFYAPHTTCSKCGTGISANTHKSEIKRFYHSRLDRRSIPLSNVLQWLNAELEKLYISDDQFQVLKERLYYRWLEKEKQYKQTLSRLNRKTKKLDNELSNLKRKKFDPEVSEDDKNDIPFAIAKTQEDKQQAADAKETLQHEHEEDFELAWQRLQVLHDAKQILNEQTEFEPKKAIFLSLCSNLKLYPDRIKLEWKKPFDSIAQSNIDRTKKDSNHDKSGQKEQIGGPNIEMVRTIAEHNHNSCRMFIKIKHHTTWKEEARLIQSENRIAV